MEDRKPKIRIIVAACLTAVLILSLFIGYKNWNRDVGEKTELLFDLKNPYIGDASANGRILERLEVGKLGEYTTELKTEEEPYVLILHFSSQPEDEASFNREMQRNAAVLLAMIDNAGEIRWTYPVVSNGQKKEHGRRCDIADAEQLLEIQVKTGAEEETVWSAQNN